MSFNSKSKLTSLVLKFIFDHFLEKKGFHFELLLSQKHHVLFISFFLLSIIKIFLSK